MIRYKQSVTLGFILGIIFSSVLCAFAMKQEKKVLKGVTEREREEEIRRRREIREDRLVPPQPPAPVRLSEEDKEKITEFYKQIDPNVNEELTQLEMTDPEHYDQKMQRLYREYIYLNRIKKEEPERFNEAIELRKLSREVDSIAKEYMQSQSESEKNNLKTKLNDVLSKLFDLREKERALEIVRIKERLKQLQQEMDERQKHKDQIIEKRLNELIGREYLYDW